MAAYFYQPIRGNPIFKNGFHVNTAINIPFLYDSVGPNGCSIVTEVTIQNRDTIQYFLTFDDFISYFYFGKGLGTISISGVMFSDRRGYFRGANLFNNIMAGIRGTKQLISFGNAVFVAVVSNFTIRAGADDAQSNTVDFNITMDVIDHSLVPPRFLPAC